MFTPKRLEKRGSYEAMLDLLRLVQCEIWYTCFPSFCWCRLLFLSCKICDMCPLCVVICVLYALHNSLLSQPPCMSWSLGSSVCIQKNTFLQHDASTLTLALCNTRPIFLNLHNFQWVAGKCAHFGSQLPNFIASYLRGGTRKVGDQEGEAKFLCVKVGCV